MNRYVGRREWGDGWPGWRVVDYDPCMALFQVARFWWWPFAVVWSRWSMASWQFVMRELPKVRL